MRPGAQRKFDQTLYEAAQIVAASSRPLAASRMIEADLLAVGLKFSPNEIIQLTIIARNLRRGVRR